MTISKNENHIMEHTSSAPLRNLAVLDDIAIRVMNKQEHLPGLMTFTGPSGFGKSTAAAYITAKYDAYYVEVRSIWTKKAFFEATLRQMGIQAASTTYKMMDQVSEELSCSEKLFIIDEFDHAVKQNLVEIVRDLYEQSKAPFILIGEEKLPQKLQKPEYERFSGRIMDWGQAQPADLEDARQLVRHYTPGLEIDDELLGYLVKKAQGSARRIVTNLDRFRIFAQNEGISRLSREQWGDRPLHVGQAPTVRSFS